MARTLAKALKATATAALASRLPYAVLQTTLLNADPLTVLVYHTLGNDEDDLDAWTALRISDFRRQIAFLREHYDIVSLTDWVSGAAAPCSRPRAVLTFDDGEAGLHRHLLPVVDELALPVTIYIATGQITTGRPYWFDRVMNAVQSSRPFTIDLSAHGLPVWRFAGETGDATWMTLSDLLVALKGVDPEKREKLADEVIAQAPKDHLHRYTPLAPMTIDQLNELAASPYVSIGAHSHCHNLLDQLPIEQARSSMIESKALLEGWTGRTVEHFAYPNGNWNADLERVARETGFVSTVLLEQRLHRAPERSSYAIPRIQIGRYDTFPRFKLRLLAI